MLVNIEIANNKAKDMALELYEKPHMLRNKVALKAANLINKVDEEDMDELQGCETLAQELHVQKNFVCRVCKNIPVAPVVQSKCCREFYCGDQCLKRVREQVEQARKKIAEGEEQKKEDEPAPDAESQVPGLCCKNKRCTKGEKFETEPIGRILRNIMQVFEFKNDEGDEMRNYETEVKAQLKNISDNALYSCKMC